MSETYTLTDAEYIAVVEALMYARADAVHPDGQLAFSNALATMMKQHDDAEPETATGEGE